MSMQNARLCKGNARVHLFGRRGYVVVVKLWKRFPDTRSGAFLEEAIGENDHGN
jgi:hypothetical protein